MSSSLLNISQTYDFTFDTLRRERPALAQKKTAIAEPYYEIIESRLRMRILADVRRVEAQGERKTLTAEQPITRDPNLPWLINQSNVRKFIDMAMNGTRLTLVASEYYDYCDLIVRSAISKHIASMLSVGKTIR